MIYNGLDDPSWEDQILQTSRTERLAPKLVGWWPPLYFTKCSKVTVVARQCQLSRTYPSTPATCPLRPPTNRCAPLRLRLPSISWICHPKVKAKHPQCTINAWNMSICNRKNHRILDWASKSPVTNMYLVFSWRNLWLCALFFGWEGKKKKKKNSNFKWLPQMLGDGLEIPCSK